MPSVFGLQNLLRGIESDLAQGRKVQVAGASETLSELLLLGLAAGHIQVRSQHLVVIVPTSKDLVSWSQFLESAALGFNASEPVDGSVLPYYSSYGNDRYINPALSRRQRIYTLSKLHASPRRTITLTTLMGLGQLTFGPEALRKSTLELVVGADYDQDALISAFEDLGYTPAPSVAEEGTFAIRGGIIDVYPVNSVLPARLELLGDTLSSLRLFSPSDQKSKKTLGSLSVVTAYEAFTPRATRKDDAQRLYNSLLEQKIAPADRDGMLLQFQQGVRFAGFDSLSPLFREGRFSAFDHLGSGAVLFFPASKERCCQAYDDFYASIQASQEKDAANSRLALPVDQHFLRPNEALERLDKSPYLVEIGNPFASSNASLYRIESRQVINGAPVGGPMGAELFDKWADVAADMLKRQDGTVGILAPHDEQIERIQNLLAHRDLRPEFKADLLADIVRGQVQPGRIFIGKGDLASHIWLDDQNLLVIPEGAIFGIKSRKAKPESRKLQNYLSSFADLKVGDLVVHVQHGIARYQGLTSLTVQGVSSDFLVLEYDGGDKIYLPVDRLNLLQRYSGGESGAHRAIDKLGGPGWDKRKARVKGAIRDMADQLLKLNAKRALAKGHAYGPASDDYLKFEAEFPYEETEDQIRAIHDVEADLRSGRPMDRLVCGDVGFGKTEVALRAAMRTVLEGLQVLVLVPTMVLCYQHFRTFQSRLERHGVRVARIDRFIKSDEAKAALTGLKQGTIDVLVGTHRMLSQDVVPRRLGLLVVDEEQRFGVTHKERLKELKAGAHVLTLTATPIPRTLHMAMVGLRDISIIATPPENRLAVKTYIARFDEALIKDAIEAEIKRGGQVFFVHNRVEDIEQLRTFLMTLVPGVAVRIGHGQMREQQLEKVIVDFLDQKFQVLLCTTIIESGVDMPNVNTLIVDHAERYGLAQLYQLRGRVGRASMQAYAYLLTPSKGRISEDGLKRLDILAAHQELGAGFQIASHDLELRGAGNLLGGEQSGHAAAIGLELYTEMLEQAIHEIQGEPAKERIDTEIKLPVSAFIPPFFVGEESQRLQLYKNLFAVDTEDELRSLRQEVIDRFGPLPPECVLLFRIARLKQHLRSLGVLRLSYGKGVFELRFPKLLDHQIDRIIKVTARQPDRYKLGPDGRLLLFHAHSDKPSPAEQDALLSTLMSRLDPLLALTQRVHT